MNPNERLGNNHGGHLDEGPQEEPVNPLRRRRLVVAVMSGLLLGNARGAGGSVTRVEVWKGPSCVCCEDWVTHLTSKGFSVKVHDEGNTEARERLGMPVKFGSCHTARVGRFVLEGHVPAADVYRLLKERPNAVGLAVPAMPRGSPGMDGPDYRGVRDPFNVLLVLHNGTARVFQSYT